MSRGICNGIEVQGSIGPIGNIDSLGCIFGPYSPVLADRVGPVWILYKHFLDMSEATDLRFDMFSGKSGDEWANVWFKAVEQYTKRSLTQRDDRVVAISAVAQRTEMLSRHRYAAGLWEEHFLHNLLWFTGR